MTSQELTTYNKLISSNNSFCHALNNNEILLDNNIKFELIIYYLILNRKYLTPEHTEYYQVIISLISNHNYIIDNNQLSIDGISLSLEYLIDLVNKVEQSKKEIQDRKLIYLPRKIEKNTEESPVHKTEAKILQFKSSERLYYYTNLERGVAFDSNPIVSEETLPYITNTRRNFITLINDIILKLLNDNISEHSIKYLRLLSIYLNLYPLVCYRKDTPYQEIYLPINLIGLRKTTHTNQELLAINKRLKDLNIRENRLLLDRERFERDFKVKEIILTRIEQEIIEIESERTNLNFKAYLLAHSPEIYNENLLTYLIKSFEEGYVEINRFFANPIIKLFYIKNSEVEFHCSARLETLMNLVEAENVEIGEKRLRKEV